jgi:tRNA threonylcarbamoyladenosine biosynthesis protein TsaE
VKRKGSVPKLIYYSKPQPNPIRLSLLKNKKKTISTSRSVEDTYRIARSVAETCVAGDVICLSGDLGAGKTHFVKGFAEAFGVNRNSVSSPTFSLIHEYSGSLPIYHFDCYRLENIEEALEIGAEEYLYGTGVCLIEWPDRIEPLIPEDAIFVEIKTITPEEREIAIIR